MPHGIFQKLSGVNGRVTIPALGAHIGTMEQWQLTQRGGEDDPKAGTYDFRAVFSYLNPHLFGDPDYEKEIVVELGRGRQRIQLRVLMVDTEATVLRDRTLLMKGAKIDEYQDGRRSD